MAQQQQQPFSSEGFDLDAVKGEPNTAGEVIYEIGGGCSGSGNKTAEVDAATLADEYKRRGNDAFRQRNWLEAMDMYTAGIRALPGMTAEELLRARDDHVRARQEAARRRLATQEEERRRQRRQPQNGDSNTNNNNSNPTDDDDDDEKPSSSSKREREEEETPFRAPPHVHATRLAVLHANRAAAAMAVGEYDTALGDLDVAVLWNPVYTKALVRRAAVHEKREDGDTEAALADAKRAQQLDPTNRQIRNLVQRLQKLEDERLEQLKAETLGKLKDLGNSILGNFGLSLDNFNAVQDPNTGSYSISFDQGGGSNNSK